MIRQRVINAVASQQTDKGKGSRYFLGLFRMGTAGVQGLISDLLGYRGSGSCMRLGERITRH
uniref:Uncharacterized protein n=1 Tax=Magnetococcus massalia (strain MO-1) TaxID=451514 RepID=A0A1S7LNF0_MAGMO|nr:protein of unknown function [Candidatus Magnetococcus massalia]